MDREKLIIAIESLLHNGIRLQVASSKIADYILDNFVSKEEFHVRVSFVNDIMWLLDPELKWKPTYEYKNQIISEIKRLKEVEKKYEILKDSADMLWVCLANVSGGDWSKQNKDWQEATIKWRDNYFRSIERHVESKNCWCNPTVEDYSQDSKPRECDKSSKEEQISTPPSVCQHEWDIDTDGTEFCGKCNIDKPNPTPKLPDVPSKLSSIWIEDKFAEKINDLIDFCQEVKKIMEGRER